MYAVIKTGGKQYKVAAGEQNQSRTDCRRTSELEIADRPGAGGRQPATNCRSVPRWWPALPVSATILFARQVTTRCASSSCAVASTTSSSGAIANAAELFVGRIASPSAKPQADARGAGGC
jgi:hypothetical protein